jgi:hypothetical protein
MSTFKVGDRVRFKPEHQDYECEGGAAGDREFVISSIIDNDFNPDYHLVNFGTRGGAYAFRLEPATAPAPEEPKTTVSSVPPVTPTDVIDTFVSLQEAIVASGGPVEVASYLMSLSFDRAFETLARHGIRFYAAE